MSPPRASASTTARRPKSTSLMLITGSPPADSGRRPGVATRHRAECPHRHERLAGAAGPGVRRRRPPAGQPSRCVPGGRRALAGPQGRTLYDISSSGVNFPEVHQQHDGFPSRSTAVGWRPSPPPIDGPGGWPRRRGPSTEPAADSRPCPRWGQRTGHAAGRTPQVESLPQELFPRSGRSASASRASASVNSAGGRWPNPRRNTRSSSPNQEPGATRASFCASRE
jgi:hypothetical protein